VRTATALTALMLGAASQAPAYNDQQHQGMVALAYKAMVGTVLEAGCSTPIRFDGAPPPSLRSMPDLLPCPFDSATCQGRWQQYLDEVGVAVRHLRTLTAGLPEPIFEICPDPRGAQLKDVGLAVHPGYGPERGPGCAVDTRDDQCSGAPHLCDAGSIHRYLAPDDHTGDTLGYWATHPDHDEDVTAIGFKPLNAGGGAVAVDSINDTLEATATAIFVPFVCLAEFLFGDGDCLDDARSLADQAVPIEELSSVVPVLAPQKNADAFTGLWHFVQLGAGSHECDDRQGVLYPQAGPLRPDEIDLAFVALADMLGLTLSYDESAGPRRFNITNPGDGDRPSCARGRAEWELETFPHVPFSPLDNLALWGWKDFACTLTGEDPNASCAVASAPANRRAEMLGWPLHALGDAVAPHHVVGTTGWGHRPYEDAAEENWPRILYQGEDADVPRLQYEQLRRILVHGFVYREHVAQFRAQRPATGSHGVLPIRALVTQVAADTHREVFESGTGLPPWPYQAGVSVPYAIPNTLKFGDRAIAKALYGDEATVDRTRALMERGAGAIAAMLAAVPQLPGTPPVTGTSACGAGSVFGQCGAFQTCTSGCCLPIPDEDPGPIVK
jgi:hypothetical protein